MKIKKHLKKTWVKVVLGVLVLAVVFLMGVGANPSRMMMGSSYDYDYYDGYDYVESESATLKSSEEVAYDYYYDELPSPVSGVDISEIDFTEAMVIKTAYLSVQVADTNAGVEEVSNIAKAHNGYVQSSYTYEDYNGQLVGDVTFRVPVDQFDSAMEEVRQFSDYVSSESVDSSDVTETYMDLDARLGTFYELEAQYLAVLDSAYTVEEILMVYDYLQNVREEIESLESSMQYYENQSSYSTITVYMEEELSVFEGPDKWRPVQVIKEAFSNWVGFLQDVVSGVIWIAIYVWPLAVIWVVWKWVRRRRSRK
ncbi:hypothetical protein COW94_03115 [Candidatus Peregrinibacteria bacterium CG22_combo_CG10-13_8_21_14_all_44_10]|nr:MAG: hypothetical protein AUK45_04135 [Candidatus Peregrinibacteria bacterium CG2_30_44_17]PIP66177.1 MAG: hypothetical protein COW94_03115 [Candidatus Peregrinibacteria bacterium CG22_combo_CG10-13_8_21_14_all_44_10]PIX79999.1 MAG: hypothetical protein COZ35_02110 [Candidatus Peregrinibacteria bacterium CG_4_10_14_3_um_filter_44_21]PJB88975.1 MAG: hypothetical protein CO082_02645 [Candidatus Peregrinibacteria bacterium CG_4_9_14_0_8_um_filter_44_15]